jgi:anti-sigma regulatory factor (Ser/Thr protein kinase)
MATASKTADSYQGTTSAAYAGAAASADRVGPADLVHPRPGRSGDPLADRGPGRLTLPLLVRSYPAVAEQCGQVRRDVAAALGAVGLESDAVFDARTVVSELFGNALSHHVVRAGERVGVVVRAVAGPGGAWVRIGVVDAGCGTLRRSRPQGGGAGQAEHGRGLHVVRGLGMRLTEQILPSGYQVCASFPVDAAVRARVCRCDCVGYRHEGWRVCRWVLEPGEDPDQGPGDYAPWPLCRPCREHIKVMTSMNGDQ